MSNKPTDEAIVDTLIKASEAAKEASKWPNMTYEQGVANALNWVMGDDDTNPMED